MSLVNPNDNYPDTTWAGDPRAPWNQASAADAGYTCGDCGRCIPAPSEWTTREFAWCPIVDEYVASDEEACDDIKLT